MEIGQKVRVRTDLRHEKVYGCNEFVCDMGDFLGKIVTIESKHKKNNEYRIKEDKCLFQRWWWTPEMFEEGDVQLTIE